MDDKKVLSEKEESELKEKSLKTSLKEAGAASVMSGAGDAYVIPYALALNADNAQIGYLTSIAGLIGPSAQVVGSRLMYKLYRRFLLLVPALFRRFVLAYRHKDDLPGGQIRRTLRKGELA